MTAVEILEQRVEGELKRRVASRPKLAQDQSPLGLHSIRRHARVEGDLGDEAEQRFPMSREPRSLHLRVLDVTGRIDAAADILRGRRDLDGRSAGGAADHHPVEKIRDPDIRWSLEARPGAHEQRYRHHARRRIFAHQHPDTARQQRPCHTRFLGTGDTGAENEHAGEDEVSHDVGRKVTRT